MTTTAATATATAGLIVRYYRTLRDGYLILECTRDLVSTQDEGKKAFFTTNTIRLTCNLLSTTNPVVQALDTEFFSYDVKKTKKKKNAVEIVRVDKLSASYETTIASATVSPMTVLKAGDILVCRTERRDRWKIGTAQSFLQAQDEAIKKGGGAYVLYFAQPPAAPNHFAVATATTIAAAISCPTPSIASPSRAAAAAAASDAFVATDHDGPTTVSPAIPVPLATATTISNTTPRAATQLLNGTAAAAISGTPTTPNPTSHHAAADNAASNDTDMIMVEEVSWSTSKKLKMHTQMILDMAIEASKNLTQKKERHDKLWQVATTKHEEAKRLIQECRDSWLAHQQQQQQQQQHVADGQDVEGGAGGAAARLPAVLSTYVLPAVPARVAPLTAITDAYEHWWQQVANYSMALSDRGKEFEKYIANMNQWMGDTAGALQDWAASAQARRHKDQAIANETARSVIFQESIANSTMRSANWQQITADMSVKLAKSLRTIAADKEEKAASTQAHMSTLQALVDCFAATAATE
jgi:hypothetical protein